MTRQSTFKRSIRERMEHTGERYTVARERLIEKAERRDLDWAPEGRPSAEAIREKTGRVWVEWFALLDGEGAAKMSHKEIAAHLIEAHGVPGWYAQSITVAYEQARGRRAVNQNKQGFYVSVSKTRPLSAAVAYAAIEARLGEWELTVRTSTAPKSIRTDAPEGRPIFAIDAKGDAKSTVTVSHERLPDKDAVERWRAIWRERLASL